MASMAPLPADPLEATTWLLVDGTNLIHRLSSAPAGAPRSALIGRLRGVVPASVDIDVVFDGPADRGLRGERVASGLRVRYSGGRTADAVLLSLVDEVRGADGPVATAAVLVVTDDRDLRHALRRKGARTAGAAWLLGRLERTERGRPGRPSVADPGSAIGTGRRTRASTGPMTRSTTPIPRRDSRSTGDRDAGARSDPRAHGVSDADPVLEAGPDADTDRPGWQPGRGATTKRGNPRRAPRRRTG